MGLAMGAAQQNGGTSLADSPGTQQSASGSQASDSQSSSQTSRPADSGSQQGMPDAPSAVPSHGSDSLQNLTRQVAPGKAPAPEADQDQVQAPPPPQSNAPNPDGPPQQEAPYIPKTDEE